MRLPDFSSDIDPGPRKPFHRSGSILAWPVIIGTLEPGPGRPLPESGGMPDKPSFADNFATGSGKPFPRYGGVLLMRNLLDAIKDEPEAIFQESGARLCVLDFASGMDTGDGVHWPESACWSDMLDIVSSFGPGPERPFPGSGGIMKFPDVLGTIATEHGNLSPGSSVMLIWPGFASDFGPGPPRIWPELGDMGPGIIACPCLHTETSAGSGPRQLSTWAAGDLPLLHDSGILCLSTSTPLGPLSTSGVMSGARLFEPDDTISYITQLPCLYALLPDNSVLNVWFGRDMSDLVCLDINRTDMGPVYCQWSVGLFASDTLQIRLDNPVVLRVVTAMGNNGLYDPLIDFWNTLDIRSDEGMEVMILAGDAPGGYLPPWFPGLSSSVSNLPPPMAASCVTPPLDSVWFA